MFRHTCTAGQKNPIFPNQIRPFVFAHDIPTEYRKRTSFSVDSALHGQGGVIFTIQRSTIQINSFNGVVLKVPAVCKEIEGRESTTIYVRAIRTNNTRKQEYIIMPTPFGVLLHAETDIFACKI